MGPSGGPTHIFFQCHECYGLNNRHAFADAALAHASTFVRPLQHDKVALGPVRLVAVVDVVVELLDVALHAHASDW